MFYKHIDISENPNYSQDDSSFFSSLKSLEKFEEKKLYQTTIVCDQIDIGNLDYNKELDIGERNVLTLHRRMDSIKAKI